MFWNLGLSHLILINNATVIEFENRGCSCNGMLWIESLMIAYGDDSLSKFLEVIDQKDAYREISSQYHWQSICQDAGFNLEKVRSVFYQRLEEIKKEYRE